MNTFCCHNNCDIKCVTCNGRHIPYECLNKIVGGEKKKNNLLKEEIDSLKENSVFLEKKADFLEKKVHFLQKSVNFLHGGNSTFTDVRLIACEDGIASPPIWAHKAILGSRSPVFRAMLETHMIESYTSTVKINDVSHDVLGAFVKFMYTAEACLNEQMACDLLVMSERYQVEHLKNHCEKFLVSNLSPENSPMGYLFAQQHNAKDLLDAALKQISKNISKLIDSEGYKELKKKDPLLVAEIFETRLANRARNYFEGKPMDLTGPPKDIKCECWDGDLFIKLLSE